MNRLLLMQRSGPLPLIGSAASARQQQQRQVARRLALPGVLVAAGMWHHHQRRHRRWSAWSRTSDSPKTTKLEAVSDPTKNPENSKEKAKKQDESFDLTDTFSKFSKASEEWKERLLGSQDKDDEPVETSAVAAERKEDGFLDSISTFFGIKHDDSTQRGQKSETESKETFQGMGKTLMSLMSGSQKSIDDVVTQVRDMNGRGEVQDSVDVMEIFNVASKCAKMLDSQLDEFFKDEPLPPLYLTSLLYYIEKQDQIKNPSWKRRKHRFFPGIDMSEMDECYEKMLLARLGYEDSIDTIRDVLKQDYNSELVYCSNVSKPNKPAHFVAVKRDQSRWSNELEVLVVVCGTKSITDVITDLLCDASPYRGGLAHSGITESGKWLVEKHKDLLDKLRELTNKKRIKMTVVGHSLGAAAATIAGIEWNDDPTINVKVVGFGCPALLSIDLSQEVESFVTTIVADSDCVPRMSMASMVNALMDVTELDITPYAQQDFEQTAEQLQRFLPYLVDDEVKKNILHNLNSLLPDPPKVNKDRKKRMKVELFPPGKIIHFYRDGYGITGSITPPTFFDEIEVSRRLLDDHFFNEGYQRIFLDLMRQYHSDNFFTFERETVEDGAPSQPSSRSLVQESDRSLCYNRRFSHVSKKIYRSYVPFLILILCLVQLVCPVCTAQRIAIIGGGIAGSFVAKYLTDLEKVAVGDSGCSIQSLTLFTRGDHKHSDSTDGVFGIMEADTRFASNLFADKYVELGHALLSEQLFPLVSEMAKSGNLEREKPLESMSSWTQKGFHGTVFHNGKGHIAFNATSVSDSPWQAFVWRYSIDLYVVSRLASKLQSKLADAHQNLLNMHKEQFFYDSPNALWEDLGVQGLVRTPFNRLLDKYMVHEQLSWWRKYLPIHQGSFRQEALSSILLSFFNQDPFQLNTLSGLMAYSLAMDETVFHVRGGNKKLISVAWNAAKETHVKKCSRDSSTEVIRHMQVTVSTVVGSVYGFELYDSDGQTIGEYDQVILADPVFAAVKNYRIEFLIRSHMDETAVLQQMPLGGLIENVGEEATAHEIPADHEGHSPLPHRLPAAVSRPFIQSVTTVVKGAVLQKPYWFSEEAIKSNRMASQILMTSIGKLNNYNLTGIFEIDGESSDDGGRWYKVCSSQSLSVDILQKFFGPNVQVVAENQWDIAPDHQGDGISTNFLLYDGATGFHGHTRAGALYYPAALEHTLATVETQAMGAMAVAKLIARRLDWIETSHEFFAFGDEL